MKAGRLSEAAEQRSLLRPFGAMAPDDGRVREALCAETGTAFLPPAWMLLAECAQRMIAAGARETEATLQIMWPADRPEEELKEMTLRAAAFCSAQEVNMRGICAGAAKGAYLPSVSVVMEGRREGGAAKARPGDDLVIAGRAGLAGGAILAADGREELAGVFALSFTERAAGAAGEDCGTALVREAVREAAGFGMSLAVSGGQGGVFGALRELGLKSDLGFAADLTAIPVAQETIEICEHYGADPYRLYSPGMVIICASDGAGLAARLGQAGIPAARIGGLRPGKDRILQNGQETRWLEKRQQDALWAFWEEREENRT